jgi:hypothetical protein
MLIIFKLPLKFAIVNTKVIGTGRFFDFFGIFSDGGLTPDKVLIIGIFGYFRGPQSGATDSRRPHYS